MKLKKALSFLLALVMVFSLMSISAFAGSGVVFAELYVDGSSEVQYISSSGSLTPLQDAINDNMGSEYTVKLLCDWTENIEILYSDITLDLNGKVLSGDGTTYVISNECQLTVTDTATTDNTHKFKVADSGLWKLYTGNDAATYTFDAASGLKKGGKATSELPAAGSIITVTGGCITGGNGASGAGINGSGSLTLSGGNIIGNTADRDGSGQGGGVYINGGLTMTGGSIVGNYATSTGGGVYVWNIGLTMTGGRIFANYADSDAGGVYAKNSYMTFGGTAVVSGNKTASGDANVFVSTNSNIIVGTDSNAPAKGMQVGVYGTSAGKFSTNCASTDVQYFFSDNPDLGVKYNTEKGYLELAEPYDIENNTEEDDKDTNHGYIEVAARAVEGAEVTVTAYPSSGYKLDSIKVQYFDTDAQDNKCLPVTDGKFTMIGQIVGVSATFSKIETEGEDYDLDLETDTDYPDHKDIDQYYFKSDARKDNYTCKIGYSIESQNIKIRVADAKVWNPATLEWEVDKANNGKATLVDGSSITVKLTNYSAKAYTCTLSFAGNSGNNLVSGNTTTTFGDSISSCTLAAVENNVETMTTDNKYFTDGSTQTTVNPEALPTATITAEVAITNLTKFDGATAAENIELGTFTITCTPID